MWQGMFDIGLVQASLRLATPILLAALGGLYSTAAGVTNIALEGMMLLGSFAAVVASYALQSAWLGLLAAVLVGAMFGALLGLLSIRLKANHIVAGIAINIVATGLTIYLLRVLFGVRGSFQSERIVGLPNVSIPILKSIPIVSDLIGAGNPIFYVSLVLVPLSVILLYKTAFGLRIRAVGESPSAAESVGIDIARIRYFCTTFSGVLCGLAGAYLSIGHLTLFTEGMSSGRGWLGLSAMVFGNQTPVGGFLCKLGIWICRCLADETARYGDSISVCSDDPILPCLATLMRMGQRGSRRKTHGSRIHRTRC